METDRRTNRQDRRTSRRIVPPMRALGLYLFVVLVACVVIYRNDARTQETLREQCVSRQEAREGSNERNAVFRKDLALTQQVWVRIAEAQPDPKDRAEAQAIADEYQTLATQVKDYEPIECPENDR